MQGLLKINVERISAVVTTVHFENVRSNSPLDLSSLSCKSFVINTVRNSVLVNRHFTKLHHGSY